MDVGFNVVSLRWVLLFHWATSLGVVALDTSSQDVCLPGAATAGCSQLQISRTVPGFQLAHDTAWLVSKIEEANLPDTSFVELTGGLAIQSGAQLAESFLQGAARVEVALATLHARMSPSTQELSDAVGKLVEDQGASPVGCKSRLKEAQVRLKEIVTTITTTASILQTTKTEVQVVDTQLKQTLVSIKALDEVKTNGFAKCTEKKATDKMMLDKLMSDMTIMRTMQVTRTRTVKRVAAQPVASLLEFGTLLANTTSPDHADAQQLIGNAKAASLEMNNCLKKHAAPSLLERVSTTVTFDSNDISDALRDEEDDDGDDDNEEARATQAAVTPTSNTLELVALPAAQVTRRVVDSPSPTQPAVSPPAPRPLPPVTDPQVQLEPLADPPAPMLEAEPDHCKTEREKLKELWVIAYEELTREVESYEILVDDTSCVDAVEGEYEENFQPLQQSEKELSHQVSVAISKVHTLRPQLQALRRARKELKQRFDVITQECEALIKTKETLEVTKEVIVKMDECAGLDASAFKLPVWVGQWITIDLGEDLSIFDADAKMNKACAASFGDAARAAEVSEVDTGSVRRMPGRNGASVPMMPTCPMCGTQFARVCWEAGVKLNHRNRRTDCTAGTRAVLCVSPGDSQ